MIQSPIRTIPASRSQHRSRGLVLAISEGPSWGWSSPWVVASFVGVCDTRHAVRSTAPPTTLSRYWT